MLARKTVNETLRDQKVDTSGNIGLGLSGGADSLGLFITLTKIFPPEKIHAIIIDHGLQEETKTVAEYYRNLVETYGANAHVIKVNVPNGGSMEDNARSARYEAFNNSIQEYGISAFFLGHTKSDQAEQVMLSLLRGSGTKSIAGIPTVRDAFIRPFLNTLSRVETENICKENYVKYWVDPHNSSEEYNRVVVRNIIKETEERTQQNIVNPLVRTAIIAREDSDALDEISLSIFNKLMVLPFNTVETWKLDELPTAIRKRIYALLLLKNDVKNEHITFDVLNAIDALVVSWSGQGAVSVSGGIKVSRKNSKLRFDKN